MKKLINELKARYISWKLPKRIHWFPHTHSFEIHLTQEEMWLECKCKFQMDIPEDRLEEAYQKVRNRDFKWRQ